MHPLYNPEALTDDELQDKIGKCYEQLHYQSQFGRQTMLASIRQTLDSLEYEKEQRFAKQMAAEKEKTDQRLKQKGQIKSDHITLGEIAPVPKDETE